jgi:hypothetical protein
MNPRDTLFLRVVINHSFCAEFRHRPLNGGIIEERHGRVRTHLEFAASHIPAIGPRRRGR